MDFTHKNTIVQISKYKKSLVDGDIKTELSLSEILNSNEFQDIIADCREYRERVYTPTKTLFMFIKQVLNADKSCRRAVASAVGEQIIIGGKKISSNTGPYCKARQRLPEATVKTLMQQTGASSSNKSLKQWKIFNREVKLLDGLVITMPDTKENQDEYPQHGAQKAGIGFPMARLVAIMSLTVGTVLDYAIGAHKGKGTGEHSLLRQIFSCINKDDIVLGDCYYPSFFLMADLKNSGADGIFHAHAHRNYDFRSGERLGKYDHIANWVKPARPKWMSKKIYHSYPSTLRVREFKVAGKIYVTTLLSAKKYNKKELAGVYQLRWHVEINIKHIKTTMGMDMLSCKTPDMIRKEIGIHFLAYNIIRIMMAEACRKHDFMPNKISFKATVQLLGAMTPYSISNDVSKNQLMYARLLEEIVKHKVGNRPGRSEPRAVKRRPKPFQRLKNPRNIEKIRLARKMEKGMMLDACA